MAGTDALLALLVAIAFHYSSMSVKASQLWDMGLAILIISLIVGGASLCWWRRYDRLRDDALIVFWGLILGTLLNFPIYAATRCRFPLQDRLLAGIDARIGLQVPVILSWMSHHSTIKSVLAAGYAALMPMIILAAIIPVITRHLKATKEYMTACVIATALTIPVLALMPAVGPWASYGTAPTVPQIQFQETYQTLRQAGHFTIDMTYDAGLVTFPSFHVVLAILSAMALCSVRLLRVPAVLLCLLIVVGTMASGWHYEADIIAGVVLAGVSITGAKVFRFRD